MLLALVSIFHISRSEAWRTAPGIMNNRRLLISANGDQMQ